MSCANAAAPDAGLTLPRLSSIDGWRRIITVQAVVAARSLITCAELLTVTSDERETKVSCKAGRPHADPVARSLAPALKTMTASLMSAASRAPIVNT
eukprot:scaffold54234_cov21-Prasinocladus_malaysianus.AAC.1